jgi:hypothetical protein
VTALVVMAVALIASVVFWVWAFADVGGRRAPSKRQRNKGKV